MDHIDLTFIRRLSLLLEKFKEKGSVTHFEASSRCPICGDSATNPNKTRFWIFERDNKAQTFCFNCSYSNELQWFLKDFNYPLYEEYRLAKFGAPKKKAPTQTIKVNKPQFKHTDKLSIPSIKDLPEDHPAVQYVAKRAISQDKWHLLYHTDRFNEFVKTLLPDHTYKYDEPRLILPFYNTDKQLIALQGRAYKHSNIKYITHKIQDVPKIYGQERVNTSKKIIVVEGPIDSLFINNSIAMAGSMVNDLPFPKDQVIFAFDREPRNKEIVKAMEKKIQQGYAVCIADAMSGGKDANEWVLAGHTPEEIRDNILSNSYNGLMANAKLSEWSRR